MEGTRKREGTKSLLAKVEAVREWKELGFASKREAKRAADAAALMANAMSARKCKHLSREWTRKWSDEEETNEGESTRTQSDSYGPPTEERRTYNLQEYSRQHLSEFCWRYCLHNFTVDLFPIGPFHGKGKIKVALDSCAGVNIGHLDFHGAMAKTFPELVASFKTMRDYGKNDVTIGEVKVFSTTLKLTHIIEY